MATTAFSAPLFRPSSTHSRTALSSEPWCSASTPARCGRASSSAWNQRSACERVLVNTSVEPLPSITSATCGSICKPMCPAHAKRSARAGSRVSMTSGLSMRPRIRAGLGVSAVFERFWPLALAGRARAAIDSVVSGGCGSNARSASGRLPSVADMPHTLSCGFQPDRRASASCTCTPRLLPSSSCHSSATTNCTDCSASRASARASSSDRLSGVVTSTVGKRRLCAARSPLAVSPVRSPLVQCGARSSSGPRSARNVSAASARMGVSHSTVSGGALDGSALASDSIAAGA